MTLLNISEHAIGRRGLSPLQKIVLGLRSALAVLQARVALRRIVRSQSLYGLRDVPPHLRRDLGLPETDEAPWRPISRW